MHSGEAACSKAARNETARQMRRTAANELSPTLGRGDGAERWRQEAVLTEDAAASPTGQHSPVKGVDTLLSV